jgi:hypothetical protein
MIGKIEYFAAYYDLKKDQWYFYTPERKSKFYNTKAECRSAAYKALKLYITKKK